MIIPLLPGRLRRRAWPAAAAAFLMASACSSAPESPGPGGGGSAGSDVGGRSGGTSFAGTAAGGAAAGAGGAAGHGQSGEGGAGSGSAGTSGSASGGVGGKAEGGSGGAAGTGGSAGGGGTGGGGDGPSTLPAVTDYTKPGPFSTTVDNKVGPNQAYTVYRPAMLGSDGFRHSPIVFGPGIGQSVTVHATMLTHFASHGFVVVGTPVLSGGPGDAANLKSMRDGLEWILAQNSASGSVYQGKLDVRRAVSMGFSVGGTSAVQLGGHEAVATTVSIHGHTASSKMHGPLLQTTGTLDTVGMPLQQSTYSMSEVPTFLATLTGANHPYIEKNGGGDERPAIVAWLRYFINADQGAKGFFYGADCTLCKAPWENPQRKNWE